MNTKAVSSRTTDSVYENVGLPMVKRISVPKRVRFGHPIKMICVDDIELSAVWFGSIEASLKQFRDTNAVYRMMLGYVGRGIAGIHDWAIAQKCGDGYLVYVDDRPISYRPTFHLAQAHAFDIIVRLIADGDYRLSDRPAGFSPPQTHISHWRPHCSPWRHGGWYVGNVRYRSGAIGCVSNNYDDNRWRIVCDERREDLGAPGDYTYDSRAAAAWAECLLANVPEASAAVNEG